MMILLEKIIILQCTRPTGFAVVAFFSSDNAHHCTSWMPGDPSVRIWYELTLCFSQDQLTCEHDDAFVSPHGRRRHLKLNATCVASLQRGFPRWNPEKNCIIFGVFICFAWLLRKMCKNTLVTHSMHLFIFSWMICLLGNYGFFQGGII